MLPLLLPQYAVFLLSSVHWPIFLGSAVQGPLVVAGQYEGEFGVHEAPAGRAGRGGLVQG